MLVKAIIKVDYGTFKAGEVVTIPVELANVLIRRCVANSDLKPVEKPIPFVNSVPVPFMQPPRHLCGCGYVAPTAADLLEHKKVCD